MGVVAQKRMRGRRDVKLGPLGAVLGESYSGKVT